MTALHTEVCRQYLRYVLGMHPSKYDKVLFNISLSTNIDQGYYS